MRLARLMVAKHYREGNVAVQQARPDQLKANGFGGHVSWQQGALKQPVSLQH